MNPIRLLTTTLTVTALTWLGASFMMTAEPEPYTLPYPLINPETMEVAPVQATHPDSHRRGFKIPVDLSQQVPALPEASEDAPVIDNHILDLAGLSN